MILPDILQHQLKVVFCGTAAGDKSAEREAYYAGPGNSFYPTLYACGFTSLLLRPEQFPELPKYGIGLTDLAKYTHGSDRKIRSEDYDVASFIKKIEQFQPRYICFNGKEAGIRFLGLKKTSAVDYGLHTAVIGKTKVFIAPSTSGSARGSWDESYWHDLKTLVR